MWEKAEKFLLKDKYIGPLIKKHGPCKITPSNKDEYFKDLVDVIVQQQLSVKAGSTIFSRLEEAIKEFTPENILDLEDKYIRACGISYSKISYIKDLSKKVFDKSLDLENMAKQKDLEVIEKLTRVKGIGVWSAKMFLMFTLARQDVFPVEDLGIKKGVKKIYNNELSDHDMVRYASRWKPYRTTASWYIWRVLD